MTEILDKDFNVVGKIMDSGKVESKVKMLSDIKAESVYEAQEKVLGMDSDVPYAIRRVYKNVEVTIPGGMSSGNMFSDYIE